MNNIQYRVWHWGGQRNDEGSCEQYNIAVAAKAKRDPLEPFEVANEVVAMRLGIALALPLPAGVVLERGGEKWYASLHVAVAPLGLPIATDAQIVTITANEFLACGIMMFDCWILNADRRINISHYDATGETFIFDHGSALWGRSGRKYFEDNKYGLWGMAETSHCLNGITSLSAFNAWFVRFMGISEDYLRDSVDLGVEAGWPASEANYISDYLLDRRQRLKQLFACHKKTAFPKLRASLFDPSSDYLDYQI